MKRGAFLHDIGKAVTHEVEGSHAIIGAEIARRMGEAPEVVHCIESHHGEVEQRTIDAVLAQIADGISGGRPGARRESLETYVKRLERLEEICTAHPGVVKTFAMQAGREVRVMVEPGDVDDMQAQVIARDIAKQVEEELQYPGQIRITVCARRGPWSSRSRPRLSEGRVACHGGTDVPDPHLRVPDERARLRAHRRAARWPTA